MSMKSGTPETVDDLSYCNKYLVKDRQKQTYTNKKIFFIKCVLTLEMCTSSIVMNQLAWLCLKFCLNETQPTIMKK